jgi:hypothetical protein
MADSRASHRGISPEKRQEVARRQRAVVHLWAEAGWGVADIAPPS